MPAFAQIETVIVTAEKKAEDIQTVPIAVTAFSSADLQSKQIKSFNDIQFNMPSLTFTKTSLGGTGGSIAIRGIGPGVIAASGDAGVSFNVNDMYINSPQLGANATYLDVERLELLRGPQGTLFGRNATGGALNIVTNKPNLDEFSASAEATYGNFNDREITAVVNVPIIDGKLALRIAGYGQKRDGDVKNIYTAVPGLSDGIVNPGPTGARNFDGLNSYTGRASLRWQPTDDTTIDIIAEHLQEASTRVGANVLGCVQDPTGVMGCLPTGIALNAPNQNAVITNTFVSDIGPLGGTPYQITVIGGAGAHMIASPQPTSSDFYRVASDFQPRNANFSNNVEFLLHQKLGSDLSLDFHANYANRGYNNSGGTPGDNGAPYVYDGTPNTADFASTPTQNFLLNQLRTGGALPAGFHAAVPAGPCAAAQPTTQRLVAVQEFFACQFPATFGINYAGHIGQLPISSPALYGISGGNAPYFWSDHAPAYTVLNGTDDQKSAELRIASNFDGPLNFLIAGYHLTTSSYTDTSIHSGAVDLISTLIGAAKFADGYAFGPSVYDNISNYSLSTDAVYGEVYYDIIPDELKFTGGLRFGSDHKTVVGFNTLLNCFFPVGALTGSTLTGFLASSACGNQVPGLTHAAGTSLQDAAFSAMTGRGVIDWTPKLSFTDQTLVYASYARGYRAGGFNPPADTSTASTYPPLYKSEGVDAIELGTKNTFFDGSVQANLAFWYYNYEDYQVTQIVNKTAINANVGARMWGAEGELLWAPDEHWAFNANYSLIDSKVGNSSLVDSRNEAQNQPNVTILKDYQGNQCIMVNTLGTGAPYPVAGVGASGQPFATSGQLAAVLKRAPVTSIPGVAEGAAFIDGSPHGLFTSGGLGCGNVEGALDLLYGGHANNPFRVTGGNQVNLAGNKVPNTPPLSFGVGVQYTWVIGSGYTLVPRIDYYWKGADYFTIFNGPSDRIPSWDELNAQIQLTAPENAWYARVWVKNLMDEQNITGGGAGDAAQGLFNTLFVEPPRTFGISLGARL
ncbi:MAG: TonB-dependent receptor [Rhizomicrobium sp.]